MKPETPPQTRINLDNPQIIAERGILAKDKSGKEFTIVARIGRPYEVTADEWACPASIVGLHENLADAHGTDSWQALQLGFQRIVLLLSYFVDGGGSLYYPDSREPMAVSDLSPDPRSL